MMPPKEESTKTLQRAGEEDVSPGRRGGGGEGTLILPYIGRLQPFLGVQILNFNIYLFFFGGGGGLER